MFSPVQHHFYLIVFNKQKTWDWKTRHKIRPADLPWTNATRHHLWKNAEKRCCLFSKYFQSIYIILMITKTCVYLIVYKSAKERMRKESDSLRDNPYVCRVFCLIITQLQIERSKNTYRYPAFSILLDIAKIQFCLGLSNLQLFKGRLYSLRNNFYKDFMLYIYSVAIFISKRFWNDTLRKIHA